MNKSIRSISTNDIMEMLTALNTRCIGSDIHKFVNERVKMPYYYVTHAINLGVVQKTDGTWRWNWHTTPNKKLANKIRNEARQYVRGFKNKERKVKLPSGRVIGLTPISKDAAKSYASNPTLSNASDNDLLVELKRRGYNGTVKHTVVNEISL